MLDESRVVRFLLALALGAAGCASEEEVPAGTFGAGVTSTGGADGLAPSYGTGGDDGTSSATASGGAAPSGSGGATAGGATSSGAGGTKASGGSSSSSGSTTSSGSGGTQSAGGASGAAGAAFDLCALFPCAGGATGAGGTSGAAGAGGTAGVGGAGSCDNLFCFDIFDCAIFHLDALSCNFTKCEGFVCKP